MVPFGSEGGIRNIWFTNPETLGAVKKPLENLSELSKTWFTRRDQQTS